MQKTAKECRIQKYQDDDGNWILRMPAQLVAIKMDGNDYKKYNHENQEGETKVYFKATVLWTTGKKNDDGEFLNKKSTVVCYLGQDPDVYTPRLDAFSEDLLKPIEERAEWLMQADKDEEGRYFMRLSHHEFTDGLTTEEDFGEFAIDADETPQVGKQTGTKTKPVA